MNDMGGKSIIWLGDNHDCDFENEAHCSIRSTICLLICPLCSLCGLCCLNCYILYVPKKQCGEYCWDSHKVCKICGNIVKK